MVPVVVQWFGRRKYNESLRLFWRPFIERPASLIFTEYDSDSSTHEERIAEKAGGRLMTKGSSLALHAVLDLYGKISPTGEPTKVVGDKSGVAQTESRVILGSPGCNGHARKVFEAAAELFELPWTVREGSLDIVSGEISNLTPSVINGEGTDYAVVLRVKYETRPERWALAIGGCFMYGTQAAAEALTQADFVSYLLERVNGADNFTFILKVPVLNHSPTAPTLLVNGQTHIEPLVPRANGGIEVRPKT